jgi:hypothetical protein
MWSTRDLATETSSWDDMYLCTRMGSSAEGIFGEIECGSAKKPVMGEWNGVVGSSLKRMAHGFKT